MTQMDSRAANPSLEAIFPHKSFIQPADVRMHGCYHLGDPERLWPSKVQAALGQAGLTSQLDNYLDRLVMQRGTFTEIRNHLEEYYPAAIYPNIRTITQGLLDIAEKSADIAIQDHARSCIDFGLTPLPGKRAELFVVNRIAGEPGVAELCERAIKAKEAGATVIVVMQMNDGPSELDVSIREKFEPGFTARLSLFEGDPNVSTLRQYGLMTLLKAIGNENVVPTIEDGITRLLQALGPGGNA